MRNIAECLSILAIQEPMAEMINKMHSNKSIVLFSHNHHNFLGSCVDAALA